MVPPAATGSGVSLSDVMTGALLGDVLVISNLNVCPAGAVPMPLLFVPVTGVALLKNHCPLVPAAARTRTRPASGIVIPVIPVKLQMAVPAGKLPLKLVT